MIDTSSAYALALSMGLWGSALYYLRAAPTRLIAWAAGRFSVSMVVDQRMHWLVHRWMTLWLAEHPEVMERCRSFTATYMEAPPEGGGIAPVGSGSTGRAVLALGNVRLFLHWKGKRVLVSHVLQNNEKRQDTTSVYHVTVLRGARGDLLELLEEGRALDMRLGLDTIELHTSAMGSGWVSEQRLAKRAPATLVMAGAVKETLLADARRFFDSAQAYRSRGVPWRRGYLLFGPPGTGKSTFALVLASELAAPLYKLNPSEVSDSGLARLLRTMPPRSVLLIEDIDAAVTETPRRLETGGEPTPGPEMGSTVAMFGVTLAGLLNALDGVGCGEGRLLVCTTNHPERLPAALVRAGRIDVKQEVAVLTPDQVRRFAALWGRPLDAGFWTGRTPADLQAYLLEGLADLAEEATA